MSNRIHLISIINKISEETSTGPSHTFSSSHAYKAIVTIGERSFIGRNALANELSIGPGVIRTLLNRLKERKLILIEQRGIILTTKGEQIYQAFKRRIPSSREIDAGRLSIGKHNHIILLRGVSKPDNLTLEQRDAAVRGGATGAATIFFQDGRFLMPMGSADCESDFPGQIWENLRTEFDLKNGDVMIIAGAETKGQAEYGALSAGWTLMVR